MKRSLDLIKTILERIEQLPPLEEPIYSPREIGEFSESYDEIFEHVALMIDAGLLVGHYEWLPSKFMRIHSIGWLGHDFLDATRNTTVWDKTKDRAKKAGGWTFELLMEVAKEELKRRLLGAASDL